MGVGFASRSDVEYTVPLAHSVALLGVAFVLIICPQFWLISLVLTDSFGVMFGYALRVVLVPCQVRARCWPPQYSLLVLPRFHRLHSIET